MFLAEFFLGSNFRSPKMTEYLEQWRATVKTQYKISKLERKLENPDYLPVFEGMKTAIALMEHVLILSKLNAIMDHQKYGSRPPSNLSSIINSIGGQAAPQTDSKQPLKQIHVDEVFIGQLLRNYKDHFSQNKVHLLFPIYLGLSNT